MSFPTALEYARRFGLAVDHYMDHAESLKSLLDYPPNLFALQTPLDPSDDALLESTRAGNALDITEFEDELTPTIEQRALLDNIAASPSTDFRLNDSDLWKSHLTDHRRSSKMRVREPLLFIGGGDVHKDICRVKEGLKPKIHIVEFYRGWKNGYKSCSSQDEIGIDVSTQGLHNAAEDISAELQGEKIGLTTTGIAMLMDIVENDIAQPSQIRYLAGRESRRYGSTARKRMMHVIKVSDYQDDDDEDPDNRLSSSPKLNRRVGSQNAQTPEVMTGLHGKSRFQGSKTEFQPDSCFNIAGKQDGSGMLRVDSALKRTLSDGEHVQLESNSSRKRTRTQQDRHGISSDYKVYTETTSAGPMTQDEAQVSEQDSLDLSPQQLFRSETSNERKLSSVQCLVEDPTIQQELPALPELISHSDRRGMNDSDIERMTPLTKIPVRQLESIDTDTPKSNSRSLLHGALCRTPKWPRIDTPKERRMRWDSLPVVRRDDILVNQLDENYTYLETFIKSPQSHVSSDTLLWKRPGLRVLDCSDGLDTDIDMLSNVSYDSKNSRDEVVDHQLESTIKISSKMCDMHSSRTPSIRLSHEAAKGEDVSSIVTSSDSQDGDTTLKKVSHAADPPCPSVYPVQSLAFSATSCLSAFLELRGSAKEYSASVRKDPEPPLKPTGRDQEAQKAEEYIALSEPQSQSSQNRTLREAQSCASPVLRTGLYQTLSWDRVIILNNSIIHSDPLLLTFLEHRHAGMLKIIYRDFDPQEASPDIVLEPTSCLVFTNAQSLSQRPLPGSEKSSTISSLHKRILKLSTTYNAIKVLITQPSTLDTRSPSLTAFSTFCHSLCDGEEREVWPIRISYDYPRELRLRVNDCTWNLIVQCAFPTTQDVWIDAATLVQDETPWELFFRKVGVDIMSAQILPKVLQAHAAESQSTNVSSVLTNFSRMSLEERLTTFSGIVGPGFITSISSVLDRIEVNH